MRAKVKKIIRITLISVFSALFILIIADLIMAIYVFELIKDKRPDSYSEEQMIEIFNAKEALFTDLLQEITSTDFSGINHEGDTPRILFPLEPEGTYFNEEQKATIAQLATELHCDEVAIRSKKILLVTFYDTHYEPFTFSHLLSDMQSYNEFLKLSRSFSTDGEVQQMSNGWIFYPGI